MQHNLWFRLLTIIFIISCYVFFIFPDFSENKYSFVIASHLPTTSDYYQLEPFTYWLTKNESTWSLTYYKNKKKLGNLDINHIKNLSLVLSAISQKKQSELSHAELKPIRQVLMSYHGNENFSNRPTSHYQYLTQAFLSRQLDLSLSPLNELLTLQNPYDPTMNLYIRLHDASLYKSKYYLYFGPLPVLTFYIPFKLSTGTFPPDQLALLFFTSLGFIFLFCLLAKIKDDYFSGIPERLLLFSGLILGLATNAPFLLTRNSYHFYEIAISSAFCFMSIALYFLYAMLTNQSKKKDIFFFSLCLSLTVAGRPNFVFVCIFLLPIISLYLIKTVSQQQRMKSLMALFVPVMAVGLLLGLYNYLRFDSLFEFGTNYQLTGMDLATQRNEMNPLNFVKNFRLGWFYYLFQPYLISLHFPFFQLYNFSDYLFGGYYRIEHIAGLFVMAPFAIFIFMLPYFIHSHFKNNNAKLYPLLIFLSLVFFIPLILFLFILSLGGALQRYVTDFAPYWILLSIISFWFLKMHKFSFTVKFAEIFFLITGSISLFIGMNIGMRFWFWAYYTTFRHLSFSLGSGIIYFDMIRFIQCLIAAIIIYLLLRTYLKHFLFKEKP